VPYMLRVTPPARTEFRGGALITETSVYFCLKKFNKARQRETRVVNRSCWCDKIFPGELLQLLTRNEAYTVGKTPVQTGPGAHSASCKTGTGSFPGVKCGRGVLLATHPLLVSQSWKSRAIPLPTLWATPGL